MNIVTSISGTTALIAAVVFVFSLAISTGPKHAKIGDIFMQTNPGITNNPGEANDPFSSIYEVIEINGTKAQIEGHYLFKSGKTLYFERWVDSFGLGRYDFKVPKE